MKAFRTIPKVDVILNEPVLSDLAYPRDMIKAEIVKTIAEIRSSIESGKESKSPDARHIASEVARRIEFVMAPKLKKVINATGVIVHTNLGRAPLAKQAIDAVAKIADGYCNLEYDLEKASRGSRQDHLRDLTARCFGAETSLVVNNNAAAVLITLAALAKGKEVIVSRGELVEIGGSFRIPDIMGLSGAMLKEIGTTNKTKISDYEKAISKDTALIMKVHKSNFTISGFTEETGISELAELSRKKNIPLYVDMGSGIAKPLDEVGIHDEWTIKECLEKGADIISFSGDKILGGPQAGIILGKKELVASLTKHPLHRALRVDKFTIAALIETLRLLAKEQLEDIPVLKMIYEKPSETKKRAEQLKKQANIKSIEVIPTRAVIGGGSTPTKTIASFGVLIPAKKPERLHMLLRSGDPPILARIEEEKLILDMRTVGSSQITLIAKKLKEALNDL